MSEHVDCELIYLVREVRFGGGPRYLAYHSEDIGISRKESDALLPLANLLFLRHPGIPSPKYFTAAEDGKKCISTANIVCFVHDKLKGLLNAKVRSNVISKEDKDDLLKNSKDTIRQLSYKLDLYPIIKSLTSFKGKAQSFHLKLFELLDVVVYTGLLPDRNKDKDTYKVVHGEFYCDLLLLARTLVPNQPAKMELITKFIFNSLGLTPYGFDCLQKHVPEQSLSIMWRNMVTFVLCKREGIIYILSPEEKYPGVMWVAMEDADGNGRIAGSDFSPIKLPFEEMADELIEEEEKAKKEKEMKEKAKKEKGKGKMFKDLKGEQQSQIDMSSTQKFVETDVSTLEVVQNPDLRAVLELCRPPPTNKSYSASLLGPDHDKDVGTEFLKFLKEYKSAPSESPFYEGELEAMVHRNSTTFCVYLKHTEGKYSFLGNSIRQSYARIAPLLNVVLTKFIIEKKMMEQCQIVSGQYPRVHIYDLPGQRQALDEFLCEATNVLIKKVRIYGNPQDTVIVTTELGRELFLGFLLLVIEKHRKGMSWDGALSIKDLQVTDQRTFVIAEEASKIATCRGMANDFKKLAELLMAYFRTKDALLPVYFDHLHSVMTDCFEKMGIYTSDLTIAFQSSLLSHLALKSAMARGHLFLDLYRVHQALGRNDHTNLRWILGSSDGLYWMKRINENPVLQKVFYCRIGENGSSTVATGNKTKKTSDSTSENDSKSDKTRGYKNNLEHLLLFIRHVTQHGPDHTKDNIHQQQLKSLIETDFIIAKYLSDPVLHLIRTLLENYTMKEPMFEDAWSHYSNSR